MLTDINKLTNVLTRALDSTSALVTWNTGCVDQIILLGYNITLCPYLDPSAVLCVGK